MSRVGIPWYPHPGEFNRPGRNHDYPSRLPFDLTLAAEPETDEIAWTPLQFDPQTALAYQLVQAMVNGSLLLLAWLQDRRSTALGWWSAAHLSATVAFVTLGLSAAFLLPWVFGLGQVLLVLHWTFMLFALQANDERRWWLAALPSLTVAAAAVVSAADQMTIIIAFKCVSIVLALGIARRLWLARSNATLLRMSLLTLIVGHTILVTIYIWADGPSHMIMLETTAYGSANALIFIALSKAGVEQELRIAATTDSLTRLANRSAFRARAQSMLELARKGRRTVAMVMFDLDRFKSINDRFGHPAGDQVLCVFAELVATKFRKSDVVARLGGEEFAAILVDVSPDQVAEIVERIRSAFANSNTVIGGAPVETTVSAGIALDRKAALDLDSLFASADKLLYQAKMKGRNRFELKVLLGDDGANTETAPAEVARTITLATVEV